jgi:hypothetical protein
MSISAHFRYRNDSFQSDIFVSDIGLTDVDVGCQISPTSRSMSMPTYAYFCHLPLNTYLSVVCIAAVATELEGIKIHSFLQICLK